MSPEDLINLATPEDKQKVVVDETGQLIDISMLEPEMPATVRKIAAHRDPSARGARSRDRSLASRRAGSRDGRRAKSPDKRRGPAPLDLRGRSATRDTSHNRSPSSPLPMSSAPRLYGGSDDDDDYKKALEDQERFRSRKGRSSSRNGKGDAVMSPMSSRSTTSPWGGREPAQPPIKKMAPAMPTPAPMQLVPNTEGIQVVKDERQLKKEAAARELEERRRSLALRPTAPPIPHPDQLSPAMARTPPSNYDIPPRGTPPSMHFDMIKNNDVPPRSASAEPGTYARSMYASREGGGMRVGLPATPKAMRLVLELDTSKHPVPAMPPQYAQPSPPIVQASSARSSPRQSPRSELPEPTLLLPSTVYTPPPQAFRQPAQAAQIQRSMSAPPRDLPPPSSTPAGSRPVHQQKPSLGGRRPSHDAIPIPPPPPPPPAPPVLKELQHLASPPPPPPAPLPHAAGSPKPVVYGGSVSGMIEIVMDDDKDQQQAPETMPMPMSMPMSMPVAPPIPTSSRNSHHRGRSSVDNSIGARITRAAERVRSVSRSRPRDVVSRVKSPDAGFEMSAGPSPYESIPMPKPGLSYQMRAGMAKSPVQALHQQQQQQQQQQGQSPVMVQGQFGQQQQQQAQVQILQTADGKTIQRDDFRTGLEKEEFF